MSQLLRKRKIAKAVRHQRARYRIRSRISGTASRPRLAVKKSLRYIYGQLIDDQNGVTLVQATSLEPALREELGAGAGNRAAAKRVGQLLAERAKEAGIEEVVFDRGGFVYHGKIKELADGAREGGLRF